MNKELGGSHFGIYQRFAGSQRRGAVMGSKEYKVGLKIHPKVGVLRLKNNAKTLPKQFLKNFKKSRKRLFRIPKWSKMTPQNHQSEQILDLRSQFSASFIKLPGFKYKLK